MKPGFRSISTFFLLPVAISLTANAASDSWSAAVDGNWSDTTKWTGGSVPNGTGEIATFNQNWTGQTITVDGTYSVGQILGTDTTDASPAGLTLSGGVLVLSNGVATPVISTNSNFTENRWFSISSELQGTAGFEKTGAGYLRLLGTNTFSGNIKLTGTTTGNFLVISKDANLGDAANDVEVATSGTATGLYNEASAGSFTLNSGRNIITSGTGDFWVKNKSGANMTIAGVISGTANFRKNDAGIVTLTGANNYALATKLDGGTLRLSGGNNRLPTGTTVLFVSASTLDLTSTTQSVAAITPLSGGTSTITGSGGGLTVTTNANFTVNGTNGTLLDMSGLTDFAYNQSTKNFVVQPITAASASINTLNLAKAGTNNITAAVVTVGAASGTSTGTGHEGRLALGTTNNLYTATVNVGGFNGSGLISYQSGLTSPSLKLRGTDGTSAVTTWKIGETSSGTRSGQGVVNLTSGSLDALVTDLIIGRHIAGSSNADTSSLTIPDGSLTASTILMAEKTATGSPVLTSTLTQGGGSVTVGTLTLGKDAGGGASAKLLPTYQLNGGTLYATDIVAGSGAFATDSARTLTLAGGTLRNKASTDLTINGVDSTAAGRVTIAASTSSILHADSGQTITLGANTALTGSAALSKNGGGALVINGVSSTYGGTLTVNSGSLGGSTTFGGNVSIASGASLAPGNSPGTFTITGNLNLDGILAYEFTGGSTTADLVNVGGTLDLTGSGISWSNLGTYTLGNKFTLFGYNTGALTGTFTGYNDDTEHTFGGGLWLINYNDLTTGSNGGTGTRFVTITAVPEPAAALLGSIGLFALLRRRR